MEKLCSKCQVSFGCKNEAPGCWCESLQVPVETLGQLKEQYENCLCPACLREYAIGKEESPGEVIIFPILLPDAQTEHGGTEPEIGQ